MTYRTQFKFVNIKSVNNIKHLFLIRLDALHRIDLFYLTNVKQNTTNSLN